LAIGGVALTPDGSRHLAAAGAFLVWRPVTDEYVLGRTINADVLNQTGLQVLLGAGSRRDGGQGLLAALQRADHLGHLDRHQLLDAVTNLAASAFQIPAGRIREGHYADFAVWRAETAESAIFELGRPALEMVILDGRVVLCRDAYRHLLPNASQLAPVENEPDLFCVIADAPCFT
jgi:imidazolonepropionase-like amidohydrolase